LTQIMARPRQLPSGCGRKPDEEADVGFRTILSVVTDPARAAATLAAAQPLVLAQDAHLDLLALGIDRAPVGYLGSVTDTAVIQASQAEAEKDARAAAAAVEAAAAALPPALQWSVETAMVPAGLVSATVGDRARYADLVIAARPYGADRMAEEPVIVEAALFEGRAPVLILPDAIAAPSRVTRAVVAFNETPEALAAARRALPLLKGAARVEVLVVAPPTSGPASADPGGPLCRWLVRHGVKAEVHIAAKTRPRVSEVLAERMRDLGADLLVMGAYGHSRLREAILGGATRHTLENAAVPVFLAH
jgi:nucleotide-binding universal stress UspA family protein